MKLADKIILLRKKNGYSQEELAELLDVSRQSVSKWEGAQSIPDLKKILKMGEVFGVTTDYLLKEDLEEEVFLEKERVAQSRDEDMKRVSMEEAYDFLEDTKEWAKKFSFGVLLSICSPIFLILLLGLQEANKISISEDRIAIFGTIVLFGMIVAAVIIIMKSSLQMEKYEHLGKCLLDTEYGVSEMARDCKKSYTDVHIREMIFGVGLIVGCPIPILLSVGVYGENETANLLGVCILLFMVGLGVRKIVQTQMIEDSFHKLLEEESYSPSRKKQKKRSILGMYWALIVVVYLVYSLWWGDWNKSWMIWPVAVAISVLISLFEKRMKDKY